jgi:hypothetical protein
MERFPILFSDNRDNYEGIQIGYVLHDDCGVREIGLLNVRGNSVIERVSARYVNGILVGGIAAIDRDIGSKNHSIQAVEGIVGR